MKRALFILTLMLCLPVGAQQSPFRIREAQKALVERLAAFGKSIPQEKVYVHMDNTCYFQGDTIWFAAYTRQTTNDKPSRVSRVLYVELLNNDGYLVERKLIEMKEGRGQGFFALNNQIQYSGFYELRAYTRWQLNWGKYQREHPPIYRASKYESELINRRYLDYEKLYSRVFPVYDRPREAGDYVRNMTLRSLRRYYSKDVEKREMQLHLYPEGGNLIAGVPNRVAFEATMDDGEWLEGSSPHPSLLLEEDSVRTINRGRGIFTITPEAGKTYEMTFNTKDGQTVKAKLPKAEEKGVALTVRQEGDSVIVEAHLAGLSPDTLALTVMHEGRVMEFRPMAESSKFIVQSSKLPCGVNQVTVFGTQGRVYADRLFFVRKQEEMQPTLAIVPDKEQYAPYEAIELNIKGQATDTPISLAVRDKAHQDYLFDNADILTEMLLSSEIRGFVPDPGWFFEKDDEEHRTALDLLMMTQGWRRFNWRDMAVKGEWDLTEPDEPSPVIVGEVYNYQMAMDYALKNEMGGESQVVTDGMNIQRPPSSSLLERADEERNRPVDERLTSANEPASDNEKIVDTWKNSVPHEVRVHGELISEENDKAVGEVETQGGKFKMKLPRFYGKSLFYIGAADTTKWKERETYTWVQQRYDVENAPAGYLNKVRFFVEDADYIVRVQHPYPRFAKPYAFHQNHLSASSDTLNTPPELLADGTRVLREVSVRARHGGLRRFDDSQPVLVLDAYEAINTAIDNGSLSIGSDYDLEKDPLGRLEIMEGIECFVLYTYVGDNGTIGNTSKYSPVRYGPGPTRRAIKDEYRNIPLDSIYLPKYLRAITWRNVDAAFGDDGKLQMSPGEAKDYDHIGKLDKFFIYTDYAPRLYGDKRYANSNAPQNIIAVYPYPDGSQRPEYRDRRYVLNGFAYPAEFYSPDYSKQKPAEPKDYRRTLYWNPNLRLDEEGRARVTLYNNSRTTQIQVEAAGQAQDGTLLWNGPSPALPEEGVKK